MQLSKPSEASFLVTGLRVPNEPLRGTKLQVRVCTIFGKSQLFEVDQTTDVTRSRDTTLGERMNSQTNVGFLTNALVRCLVELPRSATQEAVVARQSEELLGNAEDLTDGSTQAESTLAYLVALEQCFLGTTELKDIAATVLVAPRSFFEAEVTNALPRAERIFDQIMEKVFAETTLVKESMAKRAGRKVLAGVLCTSLMFPRLFPSEHHFVMPCVDVLFFFILHRRLLM